MSSIIEKETITTVRATDGQIISTGDTVVFVADNKCFSGNFKGITSRGALAFDGLISSVPCVFNVMPKSIIGIYKVDFKLLEKVEEI